MDYCINNVKLKRTLVINCKWDLCDCGSAYFVHPSAITMYFPIGWPKVLASAHAAGTLVQVICNRDKILFAILSIERLEIWFCKVSCRHPLVMLMHLAVYLKLVVPCLCSFDSLYIFQYLPFLPIFIVGY